MAGLASIENGKKGGRPKGAVATHTLEAAVIREDLIRKTIARKGLINDALLDKAQEGDIPAIREVFDRTLGRVPSGEEGGNKTLVLIVTGETAKRYALTNGLTENSSS